MKLNKKDYKYWTIFRAAKKSTITKEELNEISVLHSHYFKHKFVLPCSCNPKQIQSWVNDINTLYIES
tara:strand:+ start:5202 stop:5405 length:204 start_codon:yes stop_codon:yes gene_type:complete